MSQIRSVMNSDNYDRIFGKKELKHGKCQHPAEAVYTYTDTITQMCMRCGKVINQGDLFEQEEEDETRID